MAIQLSESLGDILFSMVSATRNHDEGGSVDSIYIDALAQHIENLIHSGRFPGHFESPLVVQLELTHRCNLKCVQCYNRSGEGSAEGELTIDDWESITQQAIDMGMFQCIISGGEPLLLGENLWRIMDRLHKAGVPVVFITNGYLINDRVLEKLARYDYYWVQISIDGATAEIHDQIRQREDSWNRATKAVFGASRIGLPVEVAHTILRQNVASVGEMIDLAYKLGAGRIILGRYISSGRGASNHEKIRPSDKSLKVAEDTINRKHFEYRGRMEVRRSLGAVDSIRVSRATPNFGLLVRPNGDVKVDCILPFTIGNIRRDSLSHIWDLFGKDIWQHEEIKTFAASITREDDLLSASPRPYVDRDKALSIRPGE